VAGPVTGVTHTHAGVRQGVSPAAVKHALSKPEMIALLNSMQSAMPESLGQALSTKDVSLSMLLKNEMLNNARSIGLQSDGIEIMREDEDAVDLVGMLFDVLLDQGRFSDEVRRQLVRALPAYARVALLDQQLFAHRTHPARRLLNALPEACEGNGGQSAQERELLGKALEDVQGIVGALGGYAMKSQQDKTELYKVGQNTTRLLLCLGDLVIGWLLLRQAAVAVEALNGSPSEKDRAFYEGKIAAAKFFAHQRLVDLHAERSIAEVAAEIDAALTALGGRA